MDNTPKLCDVATGEEILSLRGHVDQVSVASFSPDGSRIVTGGGETAKIWDARRTSHEYRTLRTVDGSG